MSGVGGQSAVAAVAAAVTAWAAAACDVKDLVVDERSLELQLSVSFWPGPGWVPGSGGPGSGIGWTLEGAPQTPGGAVPGTSARQRFERATDVIDRTLLLESWYGEQCLDRKGVRLEACLEEACGASGTDTLAVSVNYCLSDSGELSFGSRTCGACRSEGACQTGCVGGCLDGFKCGSVVTVEDAQGRPLFGRHTCVPDGTVLPGGACTRGEPGLDTGYDDCVSGSVCIEGRCVSACPLSGDDICPAGQWCDYYPLFTGFGPVCLQ